MLQRMRRQLDKELAAEPTHSPVGKGLRGRLPKRRGPGEHRASGKNASRPEPEDRNQLNSPRHWTGKIAQVAIWGRPKSIGLFPEVEDKAIPLPKLPTVFADDTWTQRCVPMEITSSIHAESTLLSVVFDSGDAHIWGMEGTALSTQARSKRAGSRKKTSAKTSALNVKSNGYPVHSVCCGKAHVALIKETTTGDGALYTMGQGAHGCLGHGDAHGCTTPMLVAALDRKSVVGVACGEFHTCCVDSEGVLWSWGKGAAGCPR